MAVERKVEYCIALSNEILGDGSPVPLQGDFNKTFALAAELGFDSVELHIRNPTSWDKLELKALCEKNKVGIAALGTGLEYSLNGYSLTSTDAGVRRGMADRVKSYIDLAGEFDAFVFLGLIRGKAPSFKEVDPYLGTLAGELIPIVEYAAAKKVRLVLEPIAFYLTNLLNTTQEGLAFIHRPGLETINLLLDTHHMFIEDRDLAESFKQAAGKIAHMHISDSNRRYPEGGNVDFDLVGRALKEIDYEGVVSLEIIPHPDGLTAAKKGMAWMRKVWG
ncbi:MAG: sugar phosphate isomerase/epimerase family protein [Rectinemataceae bacterium]|jgi:sugar phosphate isomerase/epimerase